LIPRAAYHARVWLIFRSRARFRPKIFFFTEKAVTTIREMNLKRADEFSDWRHIRNFDECASTTFRRFRASALFSRDERKRKRPFRPKDSADAHVFFRFSGSLCNRFL
jgi:hypothetical protein